MNLKRWQILICAYCCFIAALILPVIHAGWLDGTTDMPGMYICLYSLAAFFGGFIAFIKYPSAEMLLHILRSTLFFWGLLMALVVISPALIFIFRRRLNSPRYSIFPYLAALFFSIMWLSPLFEKKLNSNPFFYSGYWMLGFGLLLLSLAYFYKSHDKSELVGSAKPTPPSTSAAEQHRVPGSGAD